MPPPSSAATPDSRRERWVEHRRERRREFVQGAVAAVREHGADASLEQMAAAAGVSKSVLYRHFADRDDLFGAVLDAVTGDLLLPPVLAEVTRAEGARTAQRFADPATIRPVIRAFVAVVDEEPQLYRFVLAHTTSGLDTEVGAAPERQLASRLAGALGDRARALGQDGEAAEVWAFGVVGMMQLATHHWSGHRTLTADALADELTALAIGGLAAVLRTPGG
jgi:AcrR family transcriptional regulator